MSSFRRVQQDSQDSRPGPFSAVPFDKLRAGSAGLFPLGLEFPGLAPDFLYAALDGLRMRLSLRKAA